MSQYYNINCGLVLLKQKLARVVHVLDTEPMQNMRVGRFMIVVAHVAWSAFLLMLIVKIAWPMAWGGL